MLNRHLPKNSKIWSPGLIAIIVIGVVLFSRFNNCIAGAGNAHKDSRVPSEANVIVPGVSVGKYKLGMSKADALKILGKTKGDSLPEAGNSISADGLILNIVNDTVKSIDVLSPIYKFANGLGIGDSEQAFKQAFGLKFKFEEDQGKLYLTYRDEGLQFIIHKKNRTVMEFTVAQKISQKHRSFLAKPIESVKPYDDVRWKDLSKLDLSGDRGLIHSLTFNKLTVWPQQAKMPLGGDPTKILTDAMNPGLGVRQLHQQGVTGKGINVAIIDQPTYLVHPEFAGKIVAYHDTGCETDESSMHGPAVASLLVGTNCGTAPDARVYYAAAPSWKRDAAYYAKGLDWIIAQNEKLPQGEKIRVVSVSAAPNQSSWKNRQMWDIACARAQADGIMVLDCTDDNQRGFVGRCWYNASAPEIVSQCNPWAPPNKDFRFNPDDISILVPSSPRTTAEDGAVPGYQYCGLGGLSWSIPYCAGVLAMGWQVNPGLSPDQMRELLFKSAFTKKNGAKIISPKKFIRLVGNAKKIKEGGKKMVITITSSAFEQGGMIPSKYTCDGENISPPLKWEGIPDETKSLALISDDPDAPMKTWVHWVMWNIPADVRGLSENIPSDKTLPDGSKQGITDFGRHGYGGPCPPSGTHRYYFKIYALDIELDLIGTSTKKDLLKAMEGHIIAEGQLMGKYKRR